MTSLQLLIAGSVVAGFCSLGLASCEKLCAERTEATAITAACDR